ncbi:MAG: tagatose-bisphosphate aldolase, tagatose 1,6-diphosphate aldolase [Candidatus Peregrinibacteria bacterium GW2011_GWC2_39_14]|nr:MAG: Tagatose 1,6-diphosphate aldolase [Candidatus Peregrinibacteria bacterium GW2011_GWA2_38_36]KKR05867.1 MAG: tagatose-bisphosphate aldolase, tagatose 1,6-diphosphate aldolase [Candidatus Peregrinibacteria bacterium GW2011_GWC2_39_14]
MEEPFTFLDPGKLTDDELELILIKTVPANDKLNYIPVYEFEMRNSKTSEKMGYIHFRVGYNENIKYGGHIGYGVDEKFRGKKYALRSLKLLFPFAKKHKINPLWTTCNPENAPSRKTCELAGGKLVEIIDIPKHNDCYHRGERKKCRYRFDI